MTVPPTLPDLRTIKPVGPTPPEPLPSKNTKEQRKAAEDARKAVAAFKVAQRKNPLPQDVWIVRHDGRYAALRVLGPGAYELWRGETEPVRQLTTSGVRRGWWRASRLVLQGSQGSPDVAVRTVLPDDAGRADIGDKESGTWQSTAEGSQDPFSAALLLIFLVVGFPVIIRNASRRRALRNRLADAVRPR